MIYEPVKCDQCDEMIMEPKVENLILGKYGGVCGGTCDECLSKPR